VSEHHPKKPKPAAKVVWRQPRPDDPMFGDAIHIAFITEPKPAGTVTRRPYVHSPEEGEVPWTIRVPLGSPRKRGLVNQQGGIMNRQFAVLVEVGADWPDVVFVGSWEDANAFDYELRRDHGYSTTVTAVVTLDALAEPKREGPL
jgi:hypothetical protein